MCHDFVVQAGSFKIGASYFHRFFVAVDGMNFPAIAQPHCQADGCIACKGSNFENFFRTQHLADHAQKLTLQVPREHIWVIGFQR